MALLFHMDFLFVSVREFYKGSNENLPRRTT
jgi:hypothetical protein